jgi:hypothetical protein
MALTVTGPILQRFGSCAPLAGLSCWHHVVVLSRRLVVGIRVLIGHMPPLLRSMIGDMLMTAPGIELVDAGIAPGAPVSGSLRAIMMRQKIDVLVLRGPDIDGWPEMMAGLVASAPIGVVTIAEDGGVGALYRLAQAPIDFAAQGRGALIDAIAAAAAPGTA